jgi:predicted Na+-dependent transporter
LISICFAVVSQVFAPFFYSTVLKVLASAFKPSDPHPHTCCCLPLLSVCFFIVSQVFAPFFYSTVLKVLASAFKPSDPLPERMAAHHELYDMIMQRCANFLDGHPE